MTSKTSQCQDPWTDILLAQLGRALIRVPMTVEPYLSYRHLVLIAAPRVDVGMV